MSDADMPWSSPPEGSSAGGDTALSSTSKAPSSLTSASPDEDLRAIFMQAAEEYYRKQEAEEVAGAARARGAIEPEAIAPSAETGSPKQDGPKAPDFSDLFKHFEDLERGAKEQIRNVVERDEREAQGRAAVWAELKGEMDGHAKGMEMKALYAGIAQGNAAVEAGYRQLESQTDSGAAQHDRTEEAGWREYHQTEQLGLGQLDRSQTAGERQHESEERRRSSGMSL